MKSLSRNLLISATAITIANLITLPAHANSSCSVATRDRSNLTVYHSPNGESINELLFGRKVDIKATTKDSQGRTWVRVASNYRGEYRQWGWVIRQYLNCDGQAKSRTAQKIVTVYGRMSCPYTARMVQQLAQRGIPYIFKDTDYASVNQEANQQANKAGIRFSGVPLVYINKNQWVRVGPSVDSVISEYRRS